MEFVTKHFSIYVIPPLLTVLFGLTLAAISVVKGKFRSENIMFSFVCVWWTLIPMIFCTHHLFKGDIELIMKIERSVHFFYAYMPAILFLYLQICFGFNKKKLVIASFTLSFFISLFTQSEYYIAGLYTYNWGYIAKGGIVFTILGADAMLHTLYAIWFFIGKVRTVKNQTERLKLKYILLSFIVSSILMLSNVPAMNGINVYPFGNFMFIPLLLIAYAVLRFRLMEIKSVLHITLIWAILSSLIIVPNIFIFIFIKPHINGLSNIKLFLFLIAWFLVNYFYFQKIKPVIDRIFNKNKFNLIKSEIEFIENISLLKTLDKLIELFVSALVSNLNFKSISFFSRIDDGLVLINQKGETYEIDRALYDWFIEDDRYIEKDMITGNPDYAPVIEKITGIFEKFNCSYILPLVRNNEMVAIVFTGERLNLKSINSDEARFLESAKRSMAISINNSVMYQTLSNLKDKLEEKVVSRTEELFKAMEGVEAANKELVVANAELNETRRIAEIDMMMAVYVQKSIFPKIPPQATGWDVAASLMPMSMVSGDLYDFYLQEDNLNGMILVDVSGHGIASGLITMIAKSLFYRNFFMHKDLSLGRVVENANKELIREIADTDKYLTGVMLRFDDNYVEYVNAGHPDMMFRKNGSGNVTIIDHTDTATKGSILGVSAADSPYKSMKFKAESGDVMVVYSDGILEGEDPAKNRFGEQGIARALRYNGDESASEILDRIMKSFFEFTGTDKLTDDLTLIIIKRV